jgi:hypothetical protein
MEKWEGTISKFHSDSRECFLSLRNIDKMEDDRLVVSKHITMGDSEKKRIADLSCSSSDGDSDGLFGLSLNEYRSTKVA